MSLQCRCGIVAVSYVHRRGVLSSPRQWRRGAALSLLLCRFGPHAYAATAYPSPLSSPFPPPSELPTSIACRRCVVSAAGRAPLRYAKNASAGTTPRPPHECHKYPRADLLQCTLVDFDSRSWSSSWLPSSIACMCCPVSDATEGHFFDICATFCSAGGPTPPVPPPMP